MQIEDSDKEYILKAIKQYLPDAKVFAFGSRVDNSAHKYSDFDVLIKHTVKIPENTLAHIQLDFSDSDLPFKVDIVDWHQITDDFKAHLEKHIVLIS